MVVWEPVNFENSAFALRLVDVRAPIILKMLVDINGPVDANNAFNSVPQW